jgi:hypothetical protein
MDNRVDMNRSDTVVSMLNFSLKKYSVAIVGLASEPRWMCNALSSFHDFLVKFGMEGRRKIGRPDTYYEKYRRTGQHRHQGCVYGASGSVPLGALEMGSMPIRQLCAIVIVAAFTALAIAVFVRSGQLPEGAVRRSPPTTVGASVRRSPEALRDATRVTPLREPELGRILYLPSEPVRGRDFCNQAGYAQHLSRAGEVGNLPQYGNVRMRCIGVDIRREQ